MARKPRWQTSRIVDGIATVRISSWRYFYHYIHDEMLDYTTYIWRGHASEAWLLEPTLDRFLKKIDENTVERHHEHLVKFKLAVRGRRGSNPPEPKSDNDWWALGQHHELFTPLLDWTLSPYVAAFFAYHPEMNGSATENRAIYALSRGDVEGVSDDSFMVFNPMSDENPRLVNQNGMFTRAPINVDIETWVKDQFKGRTKDYVLMKFLLPEKDRELALRSLNRMNINHLTLFPDLTGASLFCNVDLMIDNY